ncbi:uncharacterized protein LOC133844103 [Drosophila sulfurigaster albostrigata]|uniref:uncharacterized protein LOC133844103 n=1 Tax=Drosophila sulfurigaster albostrigata TaxID=89887 RepID=UPI002D21B278|nr:uncharacterized protein LOC133844103 [Drosophila sulfurigaster albostrigata]
MNKVARLELEVNTLRQELAKIRFDRDEICRKHRNHLKLCAGGDCCKRYRLDGDDKAAEKDLYIAYLEEQIKQTRLKYKQQMGDVKSSASILESKLQKVRQEMSCITVRARQVDKLKKDVEVLKAKLERRNTTIAQHNEQYAGLLGLISNLDLQSMDGGNHTSETFKQIRGNASRDNSRVALEKNTKKSKPKLNFVCLNAALRKKVMHN